MLTDAGENVNRGANYYLINQWEMTNYSSFLVSMQPKPLLCSFAPLLRVRCIVEAEKNIFSEETPLLRNYKY
jgi:hypothetical protein